mgnify:CR=1 FL=1|jgi:uncharacterized protein
MDLIVVIFGFSLLLLGIIGSFVPVIPGPISAWLGLLILYQTSFLEVDFGFLAITLVVAVVVFVLDYFIPMIGAKKFGGTKAGTLGSTFGLIIGIVFFGPLGILVGTFGGALIGELIHDSNDKPKAFKAAIGSLVGFVTGVFLKFSVTLVFGYYFVKIVWDNRHYF